MDLCLRPQPLVINLQTFHFYVDLDVFRRELFVNRKPSQEACSIGLNDVVALIVQATKTTRIL